MSREASSTLYLCMLRLDVHCLQLQNPKESIKSPLMADASLPHAISNWHSFKVMLPSADVMCLTNSHCRCSFFRSLSSHCCQGRGAEERVRPHDKYIVLSCLFSAASLSNSFFGLLHIAILSLPVFYLSQPVLLLPSLIQPQFASTLYYYYLSLPLFCSLTSFCKLRSERPAVAVWFELFQMFSLQHGYIVWSWHSVRVCVRACVCRADRAEQRNPSR